MGSRLAQRGLNMSTLIFEDGELLVEGVSLRDEPGVSATISKHPREEGLPITDTVQAQPRTLTLQVGVSDTPIEGEQRAGQAAAAYDRLQDACERGALLTVIDRRRVYVGYLLSRVSAPRAARAGGGLELPLELERVEIVQAQTVTVPPEILAATVRASGKSKATDQTADAEATAKQKKAGSRSLAKGLANAIAGVQ